MALFDIFTGAPGKRAAQQQRQYFDQLGGQIGAGTDQGIGAINQGYDAGLNRFGTARGDITGGYGQAASALQNYGAQARGDLTSGREGGLASLRAGAAAGQGYLGNAASNYNDLVTKYGAGSTMYSNALGLNGPGGVAAARGAFQTGPAYTFNLDQGLSAINRARNAAGGLASGNTDQEAQKFGAGLASNEFNNYLTRLQGFQPLEMGAVAGRAGILGQQANLASGTGAREAGLISGTGENLAQLATGEGRGLADIYSGQGRSLAGLESQAAGMEAGRGNAIAGNINTGLGLRTALAKPYADTYGQEAAAQMGGSGNLWNLGLQGLKLAGTSGLFGGGGGGGGSPFSSGSGGYGGQGPFISGKPGGAAGGLPPWLTSIFGG